MGNIFKFYNFSFYVIILLDLQEFSNSLVSCYAFLIPWNYALQSQISYKKRASENNQILNVFSLIECLRYYQICKASYIDIFLYLYTSISRPHRPHIWNVQLRIVSKWVLIYGNAWRTHGSYSDLVSMVASKHRNWSASLGSCLHACWHRTIVKMTLVIDDAGYALRLTSNCIISNAIFIQSQFRR